MITQGCSLGYKSCKNEPLRKMYQIIKLLYICYCKGAGWNFIYFYMTCIHLVY